MEICFVPDNDYGKFLQQAKLVQKHRGEIVNLHGQVLGEHDGIEFYTIGQRKGLGISSPKPLYVIELDAARNRVVVGDDSALVRDEFVAERCNWIAFDAPPAAFEATVKIRYNHPGAPATVTPLPGRRGRSEAARPQRAITAGQAAVFYQDDLVLGGGWIAQPERIQVASDQFHVASGRRGFPSQIIAGRLGEEAASPWTAASLR